MKQRDARCRWLRSIQKCIKIMKIIAVKLECNFCVFWLVQPMVQPQHIIKHRRTKDKWVRRVVVVFPTNEEQMGANRRKQCTTSKKQMLWYQRHFGGNNELANKGWPSLSNVYSRLTHIWRQAKKKQFRIAHLSGIPAPYLGEFHRRGLALHEPWNLSQILANVNTTNALKGKLKQPK